MKQQNTSRLARILTYACAAVLTLLPFHAVFTTWLGSNFGHLDLFRIWKEVIIVACVPAALYLIVRTPGYRRWLKNDWLPRLILGYTLLTVGLGAVALALGRVNAPALIYGLLSDLRFLGFFLLVALVAAADDGLHRWWPKLVFVPALVVIGFGLLQRAVLPYDFLRHLGYGPKTIPAYQTVDNKIDYRRIQSTLRGANPLGAYLVVIISVAVAWTRKGWKWVALPGLIALFLTYSRSAYLGTLLAAGVLVYLAINKPALRRLLLLAATAGLLIIGGGVVALRHNHFIENTVFHTDNTSHSRTSSNADRATALENGLRDVMHEPLGHGPGTAGPASTRNNHPARIAENYFLQIGQEVGWLGLALFITINVLVGRELWYRRKDPLAAALLASLVGLSFVNLLSHAWADDTLGLLWWGLAGIAVGPAILKTRHKHEDQSGKARQAS